LGSGSTFTVHADPIARMLLDAPAPPGAAREQLLDRRVRDYLIGLPPAPAGRAA
jgi:hypothetical protein